MAIGLGDKDATFRVYIENRPKVDFLKNINHVEPLSKEKISNIVEHTGNHWRKIFNVFAKLIHEKEQQTSQTWQDYRDNSLLTSNSGYSLLFSAPDILSKTEKDKQNTKSIVNIVMGKTYATKLGLAEHFDWLSSSFAIHQESNSIICPYFDYRQLSNIKIKQLVKLIRSLN